MAASRCTSVIPGYNKKQKTQPYEPDIRAVKAISCAFTAAPNPFEVWLSNRHCTTPLVLKGQQLAVQRCYCLCCRSLCLSHTWLEVVPLAKKGKECLLCAGARSYMRIEGVMSSVQHGRTPGLLSSQKEPWSFSPAPPLTFPLPLPF